MALEAQANQIELYRKPGDGLVVFGVLYVISVLILQFLVSGLAIDIPAITPIFWGLAIVGAGLAFWGRAGLDRLFFGKPLVRMDEIGLSIASLDNIVLKWHDIEEVEFHQTISIEAEKEKGEAEWTNELHFGNPLKMLRFRLKDEEAYLNRLSSVKQKKARLNKSLGAEAFEFSCSNLDAIAGDILDVIRQRAPQARLTQAVGDGEATEIPPKK